MRIYGPGGFFNSHVGTLQNTNHVATVVVALPTEFEGRSLVVQHQGNTSYFYLSNGSIEKPAFCAFYTDCTHEVQKVTKGYPIVLQYDVYEKTKNMSTWNTMTNLISFRNGVTMAHGMIYLTKFAITRAISHRQLKLGCMFRLAWGSSLYATFIGPLRAYSPMKPCWTYFGQHLPSSSRILPQQL